MTDAHTLRLVLPAAGAAANDGPAGRPRRVRITLLPDGHPDAAAFNPVLRMIGEAISAACLAHDNRAVLDTLAAVYTAMAQALGARAAAVTQLQTMIAQLQPAPLPAATPAEAEHPATAAAADLQQAMRQAHELLAPHFAAAQRLYGVAPVLHLLLTIFVQRVIQINIEDTGLMMLKNAAGALRRGGHANG